MQGVRFNSNFVFYLSLSSEMYSYGSCPNLNPVMHLVV